MEIAISKLFRWQPSRETLVALVAGVVVLGLSFAMIPFKSSPWVSIAIRDIGQIFLVGILFPLVFIQRFGKDWSEFGLTFKKWPVFLLMNLVLGALLIFPFFLGVGGIYDVLIQSQVVEPVQYPEVRTLYLAVAVFTMAIWVWKKARR